MGDFLFLKMAELYPDEMTYMVYTRTSGRWTGHTPRTLLRGSSRRVETVSPSGTRHIAYAPNLGQMVSDLLEIPSEEVSGVPSGMAREFIRLHAGEKISVKDIAAELKVSRRTLENRFRGILNCGVADVLRDERLEHVASLLRETDRTATEISYDSGFSSPTYLAGLFKRTYGMTMGEWRSGQHI